jgi:hypothetical protein
VSAWNVRLSLEKSPSFRAGKTLIVAREKLKNLTVSDEHLRHIRVLEAQVEGNREIVAALRELEANLTARIDDVADETIGLVETTLSQIEALRESLHRLECKLDALAISCNRNDRAA